MDTLHMLGQVGAPTKQFITNVAFQSFFPLNLGGVEVRVDEVDVVTQVGGVGADTPTRGTPQAGLALLLLAL